MSHIPGEWETLRVNEGWEIATSALSGARVRVSYAVLLERDARLIAAAPELLEALRGAMFFVPMGTRARDRADAAIAKATGEGES